MEATISKEELYQLYQEGRIAILPMPVGELAYSIHYISRQDYDRNYLEFFINRKPFCPEMLYKWHGKACVQYEIIGWYESEEAAIAAIKKYFPADAYLGVEIKKDYREGDEQSNTLRANALF